MTAILPKLPTEIHLHIAGFIAPDARRLIDFFAILKIEFSTENKVQCTRAYFDRIKNSAFSHLVPNKKTLAESQNPFKLMLLVRRKIEQCGKKMLFSKDNIGIERVRQALDLGAIPLNLLVHACRDLPVTYVQHYLWDGRMEPWSNGLVYQNYQDVSLNHLISLIQLLKGRGVTCYAFTKTYRKIYAIAETRQSKELLNLLESIKDYPSSPLYQNYLDDLELSSSAKELLDRTYENFTYLNMNGRVGGYRTDIDMITVIKILTELALKAHELLEYGDFGDEGVEEKLYRPSFFYLDYLLTLRTYLNLSACCRHQSTASSSSPNSLEFASSSSLYLGTFASASKSTSVRKVSYLGWSGNRERLLLNTLLKKLSDFYFAKDTVLKYLDDYHSDLKNLKLLKEYVSEHYVETPISDDEPDNEPAKRRRIDDETI